MPFPFVFYLATCSRTIGLGDSAMLMEAIHDFALSTHVNSHNFTVVLGWLVARLPLGSAAFEANLASALAGALTIVLLYGVLYRMTASADAAALTASLAMVSHSMWWHSTIVESYAVNALFTVLALGLLASLQRRHTERKLWALFFVSGLALFNHVQMGILAAGALVYLAALSAHVRHGRARWLVRTGARCAAALALGAIPFLVLLARDASTYGLRNTVWQATGGPFHGIMLKGQVLPGLGEAAYLAALQFPGAYLVAIGVGAVMLARSWRGSPSLFALIAVFGVNTWFFMTYNTWDKFAFLLPSFLILAFAGILPVRWAVRWAQGRSRRLFTLAAVFTVSFATPIYLYGRLSEWGRSPGFWHARYNNDYTFNTHDCAEFIANPNKGTYRDITTFAARVFERLPRGAILVDSDSRTFYPLRYYQVYEGARPDMRLRLVNSWGFDGWGLSPQDFSALLERARANGEDLFVVSLGHPFEELLADTKGRYEFEPFPLGTDRWIYRLSVPRPL
ncbi:MAG: protein O-mannosyl-transferase family [Candidatus Krumholzibacteriia bacterium]